MKLHPIPPDLWCVPSALAALTGVDAASVLHPALNRHGPKHSVPWCRSITAPVTGATVAAALATLNELGFTARRYRGPNPHAQIRTWASRAQTHYPGRSLLVFTATHALVVQDGQVYDSWVPYGAQGADHPFSHTRAESAYLVESVNAKH
jgi:hypothetical protein